MNGFLNQITDVTDIEWVGFHGHIAAQASR